jgi:hypothetical protein
MATLARLVLSLAAALALVGHPATRLPPGVRTIDVHSSDGGSRSVTDPAKVATIVRWFDALRVAPRAIYYCPMIRYKPPTTFAFRASSGALLASARTPGTAACGGSIDFTIRGRARRPVLVGDFLVRVGRLLGLRLVPVARS